MITKDQIDEAIENKTPILVKKAFANIPSWDQFIQHMNYQFNTPPTTERKYPPNPKDNIVNGVNIRENFYIMVAYADEMFFPETKEITNNLNEIMGNKSNNLFTLINFVNGEQPINIHSDPRHSFYWQCQGSVTWKIYHEPDDADPYLVMDLESGDILFVPTGMYHSIDAKEPRTAMSFCYPL